MIYVEDVDIVHGRHRVSFPRPSDALSSVIRISRNNHWQCTRDYLPDIRSCALRAVLIIYEATAHGIASADESPLSSSATF